MILSKIVKNQIKKYIRSQIGPGINSIKIRKMESTIRAMQRKLSRLDKNSHPRRELVEREGKYYLEEKDA